MLNGFFMFVLFAIHVAHLDKEISCAVMPTNKVDIANATKHHRYADYKERRYFFCCGACPAAFRKTPNKFSNSPSIPVPSGTPSNEGPVTSKS